MRRGAVGATLWPEPARVPPRMIVSSPLRGPLAAAQLGVLLLAAGGPAGAGGRYAVGDVPTQPLTATAAYRIEAFDDDFEGVDGGLSNAGFLELRAPLPRPLPPGTGVALQLTGAGSDQWLDATPDLDSEGFGVGGEITWRDPHSGFIAVHYRLGLVSNEVGDVANDQVRHRGGVDLGVWDGDLDVIFRGTYTRIDNDVATLGEKIDGAYTGEAEAAWYALDDLRLHAGLRWAHVPSSPFDPRSGELRAGAQWQPPLGARRYVRIAVDGGYAHLWRDVPGSDQSSAWRLGASLHFDLPGAASLKERLRHYGRF